MTIVSKQHSTDTEPFALYYNDGVAVAEDIEPGTIFCYTFSSPVTIETVKIATTTKYVYISEIIFETEESKSLHPDGNNHNWATFSSEKGTFILSPVEVKTARLSDNALRLDKLETASYKDEEGTYVAANTGVLLKAPDGIENAIYYIVDEQIDNAYNAQNQLHASHQTVDASYEVFVLSTGANGFGFYWDNESGTLSETWTGGAYLAIERGSQSARSFSLDDADSHVDTVTGLSEKNDIYTLQGLPVGRDEKTLCPGIYIREGKKIFVK